MKRRPDRCPTPEKQSYDSVRQARNALTTLVRVSNQAGVTVGPRWYGYWCNCGALHLTHLAVFMGKEQELIMYAPTSMQEWAIPKNIEAAAPQKETS